MDLTWTVSPIYQYDTGNRQEAARLAVLILDTRALPDAMPSRGAHSGAFTKSVVSQIVASGTPDSGTEAELPHAVIDNSGSPEAVQGGTNHVP